MRVGVVASRGPEFLQEMESRQANFQLWRSPLYNKKNDGKKGQKPDSEYLMKHSLACGSDGTEPSLSARSGLGRFQETPLLRAGYEGQYVLL
jgi:hypothetical protein